jgi:hypothetical protein
MTNRAVEQDDEAADVIAGDLLQTEPEADGECAAEHRQRRDVDADDRQAEQQGDHRQHGLDQAAKHDAHVRVDRLAGQQARSRSRATATVPAARSTTTVTNPLSKVHRSSFCLADGETHLFEHLDQRVGKPGQVQAPAKPDDGGDQALGSRQPAARRKA